MVLDASYIIISVAVLGGNCEGAASSVGRVECIIKQPGLEVAV